MPAANRRALLTSTMPRKLRQHSTWPSGRLRAPVRSRSGSCDDRRAARERAPATLAREMR